MNRLQHTKLQDNNIITITMAYSFQ